MDDREIVALFFDRSETAIREADLKYGKYCYSIANRILDNEEDAKEVVNDTYLKAWNTIPPNNPEKLSVYLGMISRQTAINRYKAKKRDKRGGGRMEMVLDELTFCLHDKNEHDMVDRIHLGNVLNNFFAEISKKNRVIFLRRYWYMDSIENIARIMGMTKSGVKMSLLRSRAKLKKFLKEEGIDV